LDSKTEGNREYGRSYTVNDSTYNFSSYYSGLNGVHSLGLVNITSPVDGLMHNHFAGGLSIFSPSDLVSFYGLYNSGYMRDSKAFSFQLVTSQGTRYSISISDEDKFEAFGQTYLSDIDILSNIFEFLIQVTPDKNSTANEKAFLNFFQSNDSGMTLYTGNSSFTKWTKVSLSDDGTIKKEDCKED